MTNSIAVKCELNIFGKDGFRLSIPISTDDAAEFMKQTSGSYEGCLSLWVTAGADFKTESERNEFYKTNPKP